MCLVQLPGDNWYRTSDRTGPVHIVGAQGQRLILLSKQGKTYYFDVPSLQYTTSLTVTVLTVTPIPITPIPSATPTLNGDARHNPNDVRDYSSIYTPLHFILYHSGDEHWFRFQTRAPGTIQVRLTHLPADYDLYVYSVTRDNFVNHDGQSLNFGTADELVTIQNAPIDDYMVRVVGVNGAFDPVHPYQLEIDVPLTVACVADKGILNSLSVLVKS